MKSEIMQGWAEANQIKSGDAIVFGISMSEIELKSIYRFEMQLKELEKLGDICRNGVVMHIMGYDNDSRELYQIPEVCDYLRALFLSAPHIFYFLDVESFTYAIFMNSIFRAESEVAIADKAILEHAVSIGDSDYKYTVSYYAQHYKELTN